MKAQITELQFPCQNFAPVSEEAKEFFSILKSFIESTSQPIPYDDTLLFPEIGDRILHRIQLLRHDGTYFIAYLPYTVTEITDRGFELVGTGEGELDPIVGKNHGGTNCKMSYASFAWPEAVKTGEIVSENFFSTIKK